MKKILLIISLCFVSILANSQNYEPFLLGKTYRYLNPKDSTLILQKIDSVGVNVDGDSVFKSVKTKPRICGTELGISIMNVFLNANIYVKKKDEFVFKSFSSPFDNVKINGEFRIISNATENQIWRVDSAGSLYLKCGAKKNINFLGMSDSAKVYYVMEDSLSNNYLDTIYMSKNYGFVNALEDYTLYSITELGIGLKNEVNYNPSIGDTIVYGVLSKTIGCPWAGQRTLEKVTSTNWNNIADIVHFNSSYNRRMFYEVIKDGEFYLNSSCGNPLAGFIQVSYKENSGLYYQNKIDENHICDTYTQLLYQKNTNFEFGDRKELDKIMAVEDIELNSSINIYPNPSNGVVNLDLQNQEVAQVSVLDSKGVEVYHSEILNSNLTLKLNAGIYIVKVTNKNQVTVNKLVVE